LGIIIKGGSIKLILTLSGTELDANESIVPLIEAAQENDVQWIEFWYPKNHALEGRARTVERIKEAGLKVACVSSGTELGSDGDVSKDQNELLEAIELAHELNAPFANTYFGYLARQDDERAIAQYCANLPPCLARAEELGVTLILENEFDAFGLDGVGSDITRRPLSARRLVEQVNSPHFRLTFDPCNAYFAGIEPFPYAYNLLRPHIAFVHFKDGCRVDGKEAAAEWKTFVDEGRDYTTCPAGAGALNWPGLVARLVADGYDGFVSVEPHAQAGNRAAAWRQAVKAFRGWMSRAQEETQ
jgi:sugar phosphate isomerase/epimerase